MFITGGVALHDSKVGKTSVSSGSVIICHTEEPHQFNQANDLEILRLRYLHEWLAGDFALILSTQELFRLFFINYWFNYPLKDNIHIFKISNKFSNNIQADLQVIEQLMENQNTFESFPRITFLKLLFYLAHEYKIFYRDHDHDFISPDIIKGLKLIEIMINRGQPLKLKLLEEDLNVSTDHFARIFKKATGMTLVDYAQKRRISHSAMQLLCNDKPITFISKHLGFTDTSHFTNSFKKYFGVNPNRYREKYTER